MFFMFSMNMALYCFLLFDYRYYMNKIYHSQKKSAEHGIVNYNFLLVATGIHSNAPWHSLCRTYRIVFTGLEPGGDHFLITIPLNTWQTPLNIPPTPCLSRSNQNGSLFLAIMNQLIICQKGSITQREMSALQRTQANEFWTPLPLFGSNKTQWTRVMTSSLYSITPPEQRHGTVLARLNLRWSMLHFFK